MIFLRKSKIEEGLIQQKEQIKVVIEQYKSFIDKLMLDKKELSRKLEEALENKNTQTPTKSNPDRKTAEEFRAHINSLNSKVKDV
jgi:hypothetical protein